MKAEKHWECPFTLVCDVRLGNDIIRHLNTVLGHFEGYKGLQIIDSERVMWNNHHSVEVLTPTHNNKNLSFAHLLSQVSIH